MQRKLTKLKIWLQFSVSRLYKEKNSFKQTKNVLYLKQFVMSGHNSVKVFEENEENL